MQWSEFLSHIRHLPGAEIDRVQKAFVMAENAHKGQQRKSGEQYFMHPVAVAEMLANIGADGETIIAALLHDTIEDTTLILEDIEREFDGSVPALIDGVTKLNESDVEKYPSLDEQIETLRKIFTMLEKDVRIMVIKLVDRLHNMQTVQHLSPEKQKALARETLEVYVKIADRLSMQDLRDELEALCLAVLEPITFDKLKELRSRNKKTGQTIMQTIQNQLAKDAPTLFANVQLLYEYKTWSKLKTRLEIENAAATGVSDLTIVFVCNTIEECYRTLGALHQHWQREALSFQDFINSPMINGYRGLHTTVILSDGNRIRCKLRTKEMQEYARKGIATKCFDAKSVGLLEYIPWTQRISALSEDTSKKSETFWESLQSDILGDSILIHGPADETVLVPKQATALDGAFFLIGKNALRLSSIKINGKESSLTTELQHAASIDIALSRSRTVQREWLDCVHTGIAIAYIRTALGEQSLEEKIKVGKKLLQDVFLENKKGFIEEFDPNIFAISLQAIGLSSLQEAYVSIADGHLQAQEAYNAIFSTIYSTEEHPSPSIIKYSFSLTDKELVNKLAIVYAKYAQMIIETHLMNDPNNQFATTKFKAILTPTQRKNLKTELQIAGAKSINISSPKHFLKFALGIFSIIVLWGLDPVIGRYLVTEYSLSPIDMTLVRFWSLAGISTVLLLWQRLKDPLPEVPLPLKNISLWISVILLIAISLTTYAGLQFTDPSQYTIPMTSAGILLTSIVNKKRWKMLLGTWSFVIAGIAYLIYYSPQWSFSGIIFTIIAVLCFSAFSVVSEYYKKQESIAGRSAQYFFVLSILCFLLTLPLLPQSTLSLLSLTEIAKMVLFSIFFAGMPYYLYYFYLSHKEIDFVLRYSFLIIFSTVAGHAVILQNVQWNVVLPSSVLVIIGALLPLVGNKQSKN